MGTNQDWSIEWALFFDEYAGDFHPSFRQKLARQLFKKGRAETGIHGFDKYDFQLLIGQEELMLEQLEEYMFALVNFITPPAYSQPVRICWKAEGLDLADLHTKDVTNINIEFHWGGNFPKDKVLPYLKPYKKEKKDKANLNFDVEYYHNAFPDVCLEIVFSNGPKKKQLETINNCIVDFVTAWNNQNQHKIINAVSSLLKKEKNVFEVVADMGLDNSIKIVSLLLKELSDQVQPGVISKIMVK